MTLAEIIRFDFVQRDDYGRFIINPQKAHNTFTLEAVLSVLKSEGYKFYRLFSGGDIYAQKVWFSKRFSETFSAQKKRYPTAKSRKNQIYGGYTMKIEKNLYTIEEAFFAVMRNSADNTESLHASLMFFLDSYKDALKMEGDPASAFEIAVDEFVVENDFTLIPDEVKDFLGIDENARIYE